MYYNYVDYSSRYSPDPGLGFLYWLLIFVFAIVFSIAWGYAVQKIIENKGYYENWFWWGFFFGFIALLVALTKEDAPQYTIQTSNHGQVETETLIRKPNRDLTDEEYVIIKQGGWQCDNCGKVMQSYVGTCSCGKTRNRPNNNKAVEKSMTKAISSGISKSAVDELKCYKDLLDSGIITQEEFDEKKKQLLKL